MCIIKEMQCSYGKCKNKAKWRWSPDIDIQGLLACDKHQASVLRAYMVLVTSGDEELCYELLNKKPPKKA